MVNQLPYYIAIHLTKTIAIQEVIKYIHPPCHYQMINNMEVIQHVRNKNHLRGAN